MSEANLLYTELEDDLRSPVRDLLAERCRPAAVIAVADCDRSLVGPLWAALGGDLGLAGLLVPEEFGGAGASAREAAVVLEELGRAVAPVPFLTSSVVATTALVASGDELLGDLAAGRTTAALAVPFSLAPGGALPGVTERDDRLTGSVRSVAGAIDADVLLVAVPRTEGTAALYAVSASDAGIRPVTSLDMTRQVADVAFDATPARLVQEDAAAAVAGALDAGAALLASEQLGVAQWCLETTVAYLKVRRQFGRVVGGFQALKHRLANLYTDLELAASAARYAAATLADDDPDAAVAASVAQSFVSDVAVRAAEEAVQLHGGMGMTWEHPTHLFLKRAKADQIGLGTPGAHRARLADLVDVPL
ncbi:acyl-CoA dehydrogenase [Microbacterium mangrovi]|uniref:Acyl-CoA dehydrogenase n=1 Tax=Microbacterium mangrovi TaxID=1348253 RepID=A0A0B2A7S7_9MICO|nr:acyl-CoA dehydrogenase family protein [Microbacterium mangrovi]KHK97753.1 acyl-CoA dehydrogenase [Microbacterium mangrovi]